MSTERNPSESVFVHEPLPYIVRLRSTLTDDAIPEERDYHVVAYGIFEALLQASFDAGGTGLEDARHRPVCVSPDVPAYLRLVAARELERKAAL